MVAGDGAAEGPQLGAAERLRELVAALEAAQKAKPPTAAAVIELQGLVDAARKQRDVQKPAWARLRDLEGPLRQEEQATRGQAGRARAVAG